MLRQFISKRAFSATSAADVQFQRMESIYQGYYTHEKQRKIICIGRNYLAHVEELNNSLPTEPMWFDKPLSSLLLPGSPLKLSGEEGQDIHHEIEMGIVIGMRGRDIRPEDAMRHIAGYFIGVDFSDRVMQGMNKAAGADWCIAKGANGYAAVSEYIHKSEIQDCGNVEIELTVNGETR